MQVYALVRCVDNGRFLIARKARFNRYWNNQLSYQSTRVNQGGQYCLPGGGDEPGDASYTATAIREFREETGVNLGAMLHTSLQINFGDLFILVEFRVSHAVLQTIAGNANHNLDPYPGNTNLPRSVNVVDWELTDVFRVTAGEMINRLGVWQPAEGINQHHGANAIDWYGMIAEHYQ